MQPPLLHTPGIGVLDSWLPVLPPLSTPAAPVAATAAALPLLPFSATVTVFAPLLLRLLLLLLLLVAAGRAGRLAACALSCSCSCVVPALAVLPQCGLRFLLCILVSGVALSPCARPCLAPLPLMFVWLVAAACL